ncbi:MAG: glycine oxidase ThiO [Gammaproteobacteria bacterium]|nr:glycine oxidase ThiO [Gammaproteobacteria bacterium]MCW9031491.1 glycine oxidase ThiO [Gammaproteobacteria bacterium]
MSDILIIGGGIIGMLTARELSLAGMQVTIVEQGEAGHESSWAGGGIISPLYPWRYSDAVSALAKWGQAFYPQLIAEINSETGLDAELVQNGLLVLDDEREAALSWAEKWQSSLQVIDNAEVYELEPELSPDLVEDKKAIWMPNIRQVRNPRLVKATKKYLLKQGVMFLEQTEVTGFIQKENKVVGAKSASGDILADKVLVAGGAWSAKLLKNMNINLSVEPVKGQMILFKAEPGKIKRITLSQDRYIIPRRDGRVLVGSTLEHTGFDKTVTPDAREELMAEALRIIPSLKEAEVEHHWAGLRPGSNNGIPYICAVSHLEGLFLNTGHFRNGVVLGPASARLAADLILNRQPVLETHLYGLEC